MHMKSFRTILTVLFACTVLSAGFADTFRVRSMTTLTINTQIPEWQTVQLGYNDSLGILFSEPTTFLKGVEIEVKIPQEIIEYQNSMAWGLYKNILPKPLSTIIDYQGEKLVLQPLPSRLTFVLQIPLKPKHGLKTGPYATVLPFIHNPAEGALLFRLLPVMKGLPDNIDKLTFVTRIKPILTEEGGLNLNIIHPEKEKQPISIRIDEVLITNPDNLHILSPGSHNVSIVSDSYRNEVRVFTVESARITTLSVEMQDTAPQILLIAPENTRIEINNIEVDSSREPRIMEPGEYSIRFTIGDYELVKQITVEKGKNYTVSLLIDIQVSESP